jgi:hypothetical protein
MHAFFFSSLLLHLTTMLEIKVEAISIAEVI